MHSHQVQQEGIWLRFLSGPDVEELGIGQAEIIEAVENVVATPVWGEPATELDTTFCGSTCCTKTHTSHAAER